MFTGKEIVLSIALLIQMGGIIWGAAKLSAAVTALQAIAGELKTAVEQLKGIVSNHEARLSVLEDRDDRE